MTWLSSREVIEGPGVQPVGMRLDDDKEWNYFILKHATPDCGTTFTINAEEFDPFLSEPVPRQILAGRDGCEHRCVTLKDYAACASECHWAPYRRFLIRMRKSRENSSVR